MTTLQEVEKELRRIRSISHQSTIHALEMALDRLLVRLESHEVDRELSSLMRGETLVSGGLEIRLEING